MKNFFKRLKGWRTLMVNILLAIMPVLELTEFARVLPREWLPWYALLVAVLNVWLRSATSTPMGKRW